MSPEARITHLEAIIAELKRALELYVGESVTKTDEDGERYFAETVQAKIAREALAKVKEMENTAPRNK
jgi:hypothetical protein